MSSPAGRTDASDEPTGDGPDELHAEIARLRLLVGPSEDTFADLRRQLADAADAVRAAEAANGELRGRITELELDLHRARQDQFHLQRVLLRPVRGIVDRVRRLRR